MQKSFNTTKISNIYFKTPYHTVLRDIITETEEFKDMKLTEAKNFWEEFEKKIKKRFPDPEYISEHKARVEYGLNRETLKDLANSKLIRTKYEKKYPKYAKSDIIIWSQKLPIFQQKVTKANLIKGGIIEGKTKWLVRDIRFLKKSERKTFGTLLLEINNFANAVFPDIEGFTPENKSS